MIRLNQRRLIIPRGDTGFFAVPALATSSTDNIAVFSIIDMTTKTLVFQKEVEVSDEIIKIEFSHNDTVNLPVGKYVWDIKFYQNPSYADGELVNGDEIDSYYAGYTLPPCEIRETADKLLVSPDSPSATLTPEQLDIISAAIISLEDAIEKTGANVEHYPTIIDNYWYVWDADAGEYVNTEVSANGIPGPTGNGIESIVFNNDYSLTITLTDGQVVTTRSIRGEVGPPPNLTIGTVTEGATAAATITGTAADPVLNLVLPTADVTAKADKVDTVLETSLSRGRKANTTVAQGSFAFGSNVEASGAFSHAEGISTQANGVASHAEGMMTQANGNFTHAFGNHTIANGMSEFVLGNANVANELYPAWVANTSYNIGDKVANGNEGYECIIANTDSNWTNAHWKVLPGNTDAVLTIGNGIDSYSNAVRVDWNGDIHSAGDIYVHTNNDSTGGVKVATINDIPAAPSTNGVALVSVNGEWTNQAGYGYVGDVDGYVDTVLEEETIAVSSGAGETINCLKFPNTDKLSIFINNVEYIYERTAVDRVDIIYTAVDESAPIKSFKFQVYYEEDHYTFIKRYFVHFKDQNFLDESVTLKIIEKNDSIKKIDNKFLNAKAGQGYGAIITSDDNVAEGHGAFAEGLKTTAISVGAHAEGYATTAQDMGSHAEGYGTMAFGGLSHAEGSSSISRGYGSHAEGSTTAAIGSYSHTEGTATIATGGDSHVGGRFNIMDSDDFIPTWTAGTSYSVRDRVKYEGKNYVCIKNNSSSTFKNSEWDYTYYLRYAEIIGNGLDIDTRSNARALDWDGNEYLNGDLYLNCESDSTNGTSVGQTLTDIKSKINSIVAPDESDLIANSEYSIGDLLTINGTLYKATAAIAQGGAISIDGANPNVAPTTVDNEFVRFTDYNSLLSAINEKADKTDTVLNTTLSRGRTEDSTVGEASMSFGINNTASGEASVAIGDGNVASGSYSVALGCGNTASGDEAVALGDAVTASGTDSFAEGCATVASGDFSHAQGEITIANLYAMCAMGAYNVEGAHYPEWVADKQYEVGDRVVVTSANGSKKGYICIKANKDLTFKSANWDWTVSNGVDAVTVGNGKYGSRSNAYMLDWEGNEHIAGDIYINCNPDSSGGTALGAAISNKADKANPVFTGSVSMGRKDGTTVGEKSTALGDTVEASGWRSFAEGYGTKAAGDLTHAEGEETQAIGYSAHAEGSVTVAKGYAAHAEGYKTIAMGNYSHVSGTYNVAEFDYDQIPLWNASVDYAVGDRVTTDYQNTVYYVAKVANKNVPTHNTETWEEHWYNGFAEIVGNGTTSNARSNAYALDWDGTGHFAGDIYVNCNTDSTGGYKLISAADVATTTETQAIITEYGVSA